MPVVSLRKEPVRPRRMRWPIILLGLALASVASAMVIPSLFPFRDPTGLVSTYNSAGPIDQSNPFFQSLGTNGRSCSTCHLASDAMGLSAQTVRATYQRTHGQDPLFASVDGANCPNGVPGNPADHSLLLKSGLIRVALTLPAGAQFTISAVHDPYGCAILPDPQAGGQSVSVYRRPLPSTNLRFLSAVMFDGRETVQPLNNASTFQANLVTDLMHQAVDATTGHAQATSAPTLDQQTAIVNFELGLTSAQFFDNQAGLLSSRGAHGGPMFLFNQEYHPGTNDSLGADPNGQPFNPAGTFTLYTSWENSRSRFFSGDDDNFRQMVAAGEVLFNTRPLLISSVRGLNDNSALGAVPVAPFMGTCTTCHDTPNVGNHSFPLPLDIGTGHNPAYESDPIIANATSQLDFPDLPVYKIEGCPNPFDPSSTSPYVIYTTDPGKALLTGKCSDLNRIKGPILRGLAARAPYFHNGAAQNLTQLLNFYNQRFQMNLTDQEKAELIAFLNTL